MTTTVVARGAEWSSSTLHDGWGDVTDAQVTELCKLVTVRFERLADRAGYNVVWLPSTSEVVGPVQDVYDDCGDCELDAIRDQARDEVWQAVIGDGGPMEEAVTRIFEEVE